jgi:hypothetical protein
MDHRHTGTDDTSHLHVPRPNSPQRGCMSMSLTHAQHVLQAEQEQKDERMGRYAWGGTRHDTG